MSRGLPYKVSNLLQKAKDSAILAVEIYNKPTIIFRSGGFIVLMCIAWNSLLQAIFETKGVKYFYRLENGRYKMIDGDKKAWELDKLVDEFYNPDGAIKSNLKFFIAIRNKIEHRYMPNLDPEIAGECQALLLNFEELIVQEYGAKYSLVDSLFIPLQITERKRVLPKTKDEKKIIEFINTFRSALSDEVTYDPKYSFKAILIPKIGNHFNTSDIAIEFIKFNVNNSQEMEKYERMIVAIKEKQVAVTNAGKYPPGGVLRKINELINIDVNMNWHTEMWKKYRVRPESKDLNKAECNTKYCQYDVAHKDYVYTNDWINMLIDNELK
jgi:hypothetical protein